tara:strand:- start:16309 stop:17256 length:948 start_codon:yes stop_codon:yes gene_type:complete
MNNQSTNENKLIDFLIIGAMKAGTTTVAEIMNYHPKLFIPESKEPSYFIDWNNEFYNSYGENISWKSESANDFRSYKELFKSATPNTLKGEASTLYLPSKGSPKLVYDHNPKMKLIVILREPIARAYSAYNYNMTHQKERCYTFADAVNEELDGKRNNYIYNARYLYYGLYHKHLQNWLKYFSTTQIKILDFNNLVEDPVSFYKEISQFLEIDDFDSYVKDFNKKYNVGTIPKNKVSKKLWGLLEKPSGLKLTIKRYIDNNFLARLKKVFRTYLVSSHSREVGKKNLDEFKYLEDYFSDDLKNLKNSFGFSLSKK